MTKTEKDKWKKELLPFTSDGIKKTKRAEVNRLYKAILDKLKHHFKHGNKENKHTK